MSVRLQGASQSIIVMGVVALWLLSLTPAHGMTSAQQARVHQLEVGFRDAAQHDKVWTNTWAGIYGGAAVAYGAVSRNASDADDRFDARVSAVKSVLALGNLYLNPQPHRPALKKYRAAAASASDDAEHLKLAEALREELARQERGRQGLNARMLPFAVNLAAGLTIGVIDDRPEDGAINFAVGMLVNEVAIRTQPDSMAGYGKPVTVNIGPQPLEVAYQWIVTPASVGLGIRF